MGLRLFWHQNAKFCSYGRTGRTTCGFLNMSRYLTLSPQDKMLIEAWDWNRTCSGCTGKETVGWSQVEDQMVRVQRDSEWRTRKEPCSMLSPSFFSWDPNAYKEERDKTNERTEYQFRFPVAPYNTTVWPFSYSVILCNHDRSISRWVTSESRSFNVIQIEIRFVILKRHFPLSCQTFKHYHFNKILFYYIKYNFLLLRIYKDIHIRISIEKNVNLWTLLNIF